MTSSSGGRLKARVVSSLSCERTQASSPDEHPNDGARSAWPAAIASAARRYSVSCWSEIAATAFASNPATDSSSENVIVTSAVGVSPRRSRMALRYSRAVRRRNGVRATEMSLQSSAGFGSSLLPVGSPSVPTQPAHRPTAAAIASQRTRVVGAARSVGSRRAIGARSRKTRATADGAKLATRGWRLFAVVTPVYTV